MSLSQLIREEGKQRLARGELPNMAQFFQWQKVADFVAKVDDGPAFSEDALAQALRAHNTRRHDVGAWEDCTDQVKELWRGQAAWISNYLKGVQ